MATCSPRVGITLAGARQPRFRRRAIQHPSPPIATNASVVGSGTATDPSPVFVPVLMRGLGNSPRGVSQGGA